MMIKHHPGLGEQSVTPLPSEPAHCRSSSLPSPPPTFHDWSSEYLRTPWQTPWRRQPPKRTPQAKLPPEANSTNQVPHVFPLGPPSPQGSRGEPTAGTDVGDYNTATKRTLSAGVLDGVPSQESRTRGCWH
ncbi:hypothetical protein H634G_03562 [Metarhizium anisopliae BRIP 53293]|uniref:Uncharacterized protein n=1 Tax=Metarhizium anisopliae BRIP 53293 TaxID=1291518 RepID=A0A0D9P4A4_METAN|nr:hypothetical protein H634G_03562 [Metarhizium anisopliae BRIP 53293]